MIASYCAQETQQIPAHFTSPHVSHIAVRFKLDFMVPDSISSFIPTIPSLASHGTCMPRLKLVFAVVETVGLDVPKGARREKCLKAAARKWVKQQPNVWSRRGLGPLLPGRSASQTSGAAAAFFCDYSATSWNPYISGLQSSWLAKHLPRQQTCVQGPQQLGLPRVHA